MEYGTALEQSARLRLTPTVSSRPRHTSVPNGWFRGWTPARMLSSRTRVCRIAWRGRGRSVSTGRSRLVQDLLTKSGSSLADHGRNMPSTRARFVSADHLLEDENNLRFINIACFNSMPYISQCVFCAV